MKFQNLALNKWPYNENNILVTNGECDNLIPDFLQTPYVDIDENIVEKYSIGKAKDYLKEADPFHQAENNQEYWKRLDQGFDLIKQNPEIKDGDNVLLISHGNTLLSVVERYGNGQFDVTERPANGSLTKLTVDGDDIHVVAFNQQ